RNIRHNYSAIGTYTVIHKVYNAVTRCTDSTTNTVTILRVRNCLALDISMVADSFYTSKYTFQLSYDKKYESAYDPMDSVRWDFGDNTPGYTGRQPTHTFDSSKYYTV